MKLLNILFMPSAQRQSDIFSNKKLVYTNTNIVKNAIYFAFLEGKNEILM